MSAPVPQTRRRCPGGGGGGVFRSPPWAREQGTCWSLPGRSSGARAGEEGPEARLCYSGRRGPDQTAQPPPAPPGLPTCSSGPRAAPELNAHPSALPSRLEPASGGPSRAGLSIIPFYR